MEDFFVQEYCVDGTDLENHGPTSILCDDPLPIESSVDLIVEPQRVCLRSEYVCVCLFVCMSCELEGR